MLPQNARTAYAALAACSRQLAVTSCHCLPILSKGINGSRDMPKLPCSALFLNA